MLCFIWWVSSWIGHCVAGCSVCSFKNDCSWSPRPLNMKALSFYETRGTDHTMLQCHTAEEQISQPCCSDTHRTCMANRLYKAYDFDCNISLAVRGIFLSSKVSRPALALNQPCSGYLCREQSGQGVKSLLYSAVLRKESCCVSSPHVYVYVMCSNT
jgi:hypothetical protein